MIAKSDAAIAAARPSISRGLRRERHAFATSIKGDHCDGRLSRHAAMKRVNHLGHHLQTGRGSMSTSNKNIAFVSVITLLAERCKLCF
jgi:hypothetical protein